MAPSERLPTRGPLRVDQLKEGDRYELSEGHALYCAPSGPRHARPHALGAGVLVFDPAVTEAGVDAGHELSSGTMRAPDISIGNVPDASGWAQGAPPLAVEYASEGQDEGELRVKIGELLANGCRQVWVVRLVGPRRVEVHSSRAPKRDVLPGQLLSAPGVLKNDVPVEALYDRRAAVDMALRNLLEQKGYASLDDVLAHGRQDGYEKGLEEGRRELEQSSARAAARASAGAVLQVLEGRGLAPSEAERERILSSSDVTELRRWLSRAMTCASAGEVFAAAAP